MESYQYGRKCTLLVSDRNGDGLDLSNLKIKFTVKRSDVQTPNIAEIVVYNLEEQTAKRIQKEFSNVILQAGYEANFGVIFQGNIKQIIGPFKMNGTDSILTIIAGDGDLSYNYAVVNATLGDGATQEEQIATAIAPMSKVGGTGTGNVGNLPKTTLPRGKVMFGMSRDYLQQSADTANQTWSIQDGKVNFIPLTSYLPGEAVVLTSKTGMIDAPQQTNEGVNVKCLLNPKIKIGCRMKLDNASIARLKIDLSQPNSPANIPAPITLDGVYYVLTIEHQGDNRGQEWWTNLICISMDVTTNPINAVQVGY